MIRYITAFALVCVMVTSCVLVARPSDLIYKPYCEPINDYVWHCRDGYRGDLWRCVFQGRWRCARVP